MRSTHPIGVTLALALGWSLLPACGPIAFQDTVNLGGPAPAVAEAPPEKPKRVRMTSDHLELEEKIQFDYNEATIKSESFSLLDEVVETIKEHPDISEIHLIGHTDADGAKNYNKKLSTERAAAVEAYLTEHGIDKMLIDSKGMGEDQPIADNDTDEGKEKNRRVEFLIKLAPKTEGGEAEGSGGAGGPPARSGK